MSKIITCPHDAFFKSWISDKKLAIEYLKSYLPDKWRGRIDLNTLRTQETSFVDADLSRVYSDKLFKVEIDKQESYLYILCEHQTNPHPYMPLRIWHYIVKILYQHVEKQKNIKLIPILPIVLYTGKQKYCYTLNIWDLFENKVLAQEALFQPLTLIDLYRIPDEELKKHVLLGVIEMVFKHAKERDIIKTIKELLIYFPELEIQIGNNIILSIYQYVINVADIDEQQLANLISERVTPGTGEKIMTAAERLRQEGKYKGMKIGLKKGRSEGKKMLMEKISQIFQTRHKPINDINELTALLAEELEPETKVDEMKILEPTE